MAAPRLDRYLVESELGQGGMSVVYRARDTKLPRPVAVKVLHDFLARQDEARHRFHREAVAVASLEHRAILAIYDYSGPRASPSYIVTELIDGPTLRSLIDTEGPLPWPEMGMLVAAELAAALAHAHAAGVVHRDIKPENVMIHRDGQLKLMDFGIAEMVGGSTQLTATGALIGSPAHMAPELIDGKSPDHRADVFSLGTLLYWLTTGRLPFEAPNPSALFKRILDGVYEPPQHLQPKIGNGLARIIERCLAPDPERRLPSAQALHDALVQELEPLGLTPVETMARKLLTDRAAFEATQRDLMLDGLVAMGEAAVEERRLARASDAFNRVLAHDPTDARAQHWLRSLHSNRRRRRRVVLAAALIAGGTAAAGGALALRSSGGGTKAWAEIDRTSGAPGPAGEAPAPLAAVDAFEPPAPIVAESEPAPRALSRSTDSSGRAAVDRAERRDQPGRDEAPGQPGRADRSAPAVRSAPADRAGQRARGDRRDRRDRPAGRAQGLTPGAPREAPAPATATLTVQIGRAYADIYVDDVLVADLKFRARIELREGTHSVSVVRDRQKILERLGLDAVPDDRSLPQFGRFAPRRIEVTPEGRILEQRDGRAIPLADDVLLFKIPVDPREEREIEGWISS